MYAAHHAAVLDAAPVVGKRDGAGTGHVAHLGKLGALQPLRARADRVDVRATGRVCGFLELVGDHRRVVDGGLGVGHGSDAGKAALCRGAHTGDDVFLVLLARIAEVDVHVDHAGHEVLAREVLDLGVLRSGKAGAGSRHAAIAHEQVCDSVDSRRGVDEMGILKKQGHCCHLQGADTLRTCAPPHRH